jgi:hypothetical protein
MEAEDHMDRPDFPTMEQVEKATHEQLARWYRFLPSGDTKEQQKIQDLCSAKNPYTANL